VKVLFLSSHPDDVEICAGGTLTRFLDEGHDIHWLVFTSPSIKRIMEAGDVINHLEKTYDRTIPVIFHGFNDKHLEKDRQKVLDILFDIGEALEPDVVIGPHKDGHQDHQTLHREMLCAFGRTCSIWCYEPGTHIEFRPNMYVRLTKEHVQNKIKMVSMYGSQKDKYYSQKGLIFAKARFWGSKCDSEYAEVFDIIRERI